MRGAPLLIFNEGVGAGWRLQPNPPRKERGLQGAEKIRLTLGRHLDE